MRTPQQEAALSSLSTSRRGLLAASKHLEGARAALLEGDGERAQEEALEGLARLAEVMRKHEALGAAFESGARLG